MPHYIIGRGLSRNLQKNLLFCLKVSKTFATEVTVNYKPLRHVEHTKCMSSSILSIYIAIIFPSETLYNVFFKTILAIRFLEIFHSGGILMVHLSTRATP